jgi:NAD(P)H-hydrate epimerase
MRGAAALAARGALRAGAGLVTVASVVEVCDAVSALLPEVMLIPLEDDDGVLSPDSAEAILDLQDRASCAVFGPGMTTHEAVRALLTLVWKDWSLPCVVDADALNAVSLGLTLPDAPCVLTPHPGEMARLLGMSSEKVQSDRFRAAQLAVEKYGRTVLLKGAYSVVSEREGNLLVNTTGNPGMAAGGMGDVLAGVIGGLLAQGLPTLQAAAVGAFLHGAAGDLCADKLGPVGFTASDLAFRIPAARAKLEQWYQD